MDKEMLIELFNSSESIAEICRKLYGKNNGGMHNRVLKLFEELEYDWNNHLSEIEESKKRYCLNCGKEIVGKERKRKKFCCSSCATQYNNKLRERSKESKEAISNSLRKYYANNPMTDEAKSAISEGLKKYHSTHILTDEEKWEHYRKYYNPNISFEEYVNFVMGARHDSTKIRKRKENKEPLKCIVCGKELDGIKTTFCSIECRKKFEDNQYEEYIERWKKREECGHTPSFKIHKYVKRYLLEKYNNSCQECGWNKENPHTHNVPLQIHHIDGDCTNNSEDNLQLLCPNCHALTENFGSRNKNSKRVFRKQKLFSQEIVKQY